ncbi:MAG: hypothetical protein LBB98_10480 [Treponema sp.]|jgi:hypothetical protein|nr:hypothetical protein [Treponema sp.]
MPNGEPWLSGSWEQQLVMAENWLAALASKAEEWNIPAAEVAALRCLTEAAALAAARNVERTLAVAANCRAFFDALNAEMWFIQNQYFFVPPLKDADIVSLGLKPRDQAHTPVSSPVLPWRLPPGENRPLETGVQRGYSLGTAAGHRRINKMHSSKVD